jgi:two-component sensor histidine kinase
MLAAKMKNYKAADSLAASSVNLLSKIADKDLQNSAIKKFNEGNKDLKEEMLSPDSTLTQQLNNGNKVNRKMNMYDSGYRKLEDLNIYTGKDIREDSTVLFLANQQINDLETKYRTQKIADSLQNQQQENLIANQNLKQRNYFLAGAGLLVLLLIGFGWLQFQNRKRAVKDKEHIQLLQNEIHHRVKNNLAVINRLVEVAGKNAADNVPLSALKNRIKSIELLHKHLYSDEAKPGHISLQPYLEDLCMAIAATFESSKNIEIKINANENVKDDIAEKLGLIINELVTNSYKYAFEGKAGGAITIVAGKNETNELQLTLQDNGVGFDKDIKKDSYGMKLIRGLSHQLDGKFSFENNNGTRFNLVIPA